MKNKKHFESSLSSHASVFFATFSRYEKGGRLPTNGMVEPMLSYLLPRVRKILLLDAPHLISDTVDPVVEIYEGKRRTKRFVVSKFFYLPIYLLCRLPSESETRISFKLRDFLSVFIAAFGESERFDVFIGLESIYALAGILLQKLGKVKKVIYYVSDFSPRRFGNTFFNRAYLSLDRFCLHHADYTWDVSTAIQKGRYEAGLPPAGHYRVIHVPNGLFPSQIQSLPIAKRNRFDLVYMGILEPDMGADLAIRALSEVRRFYPQTRLHVIGGPEKHIEPLRDLTRSLGLERWVIFHGFIPSFRTMAKTVRHCSIGLAPYRSFPDSKRWYGDAGKVRQYTAAGLPVVTTHVPPYGVYAVHKGAGIMTNDTVESFSQGILKLLDDRILYQRCARAASTLSRDNTWENVYRRAFASIWRL